MSRCGKFVKCDRTGGKDAQPLLPQENSIFVEQAGKPVLDAKLTPHQKIPSLWNRPESLFLSMIKI
ncbi:hypothetical protein Q5688_16085 [Microcoleus sp. herbarium5]